MVDQVARRQRGIEPGPRTDMVIVDKDIDVRPRLAAFVAQPHIDLRIVPRHLLQHSARIVSYKAKLCLASAKRLERRRDRNVDFRNSDVHRPGTYRNHAARSMF